MSPAVHEIDPNADALIILRNPSTNFAPWPEATRNYHSQTLPLRSQQGQDSGDGSKNVASQDEMKDVRADTSAVSNAEAAVDEVLHYRVSSRHLMLASSVFACALGKAGWSESVRNEDDGLVHITAHEWDPKAFLIFLNILHLRNRQIPNTVPLETAAKIAVLVDYYACEEATQFVTSMWVDALKKDQLPTTYSRDLVLWICISWVFDSAEMFARTTAFAIKVAEETVPTLGLPIPDSVISDIDCKRYQAIESVTCQLYHLLDTYRSSDYRCPIGDQHSFLCGVFMLGALTKELDRMALLSPRLEVPFSGLSLAALCDNVKTVRSPPWIINTSSYSKSYHTHPCNLNKIVTDIVAIAMPAVTGLPISDYVAVTSSRGRPIQQVVNE